MTISDRLKSERERLGLSQPRFGKAAGVVKQTVIQWEKGVSSPTTVQLSALSEVGVDVFYVLGQHDTPFKQPDQVNQDVVPYGLKSDEAALLTAYRRQQPSVQEAALRMLNADVPSTPHPMPDDLVMQTPADSEIPATMRHGGPSDQVPSDQRWRKKK
jgi:transcriptional regulator with XRE-family HTH domain